MRGAKRALILCAAAAAFFGCAEKNKGPVECAAPGRTPALFIVNGLSETLTRYDVAKHAVACQSAVLGPGGVASAPNEAVVDGDRLYVVNSGANNVDVFSLPGLSRAGVIDLGAGSNPWAIAIEGDHAFVTNQVSGDLARIDLGTLHVTARAPAGEEPEGLAIAAGRVFVANTAFRFSGGQITYGPGLVTVHDGSTGAVLDTLHVGTNPQAVLVDSTGFVNVLCTGDYGAASGRIFFIDPAVPAVVDSLDLGGSPGFFALADSGKVFVAAWAFGGAVSSNGLMLYDAERRAVLRGASDPLVHADGFEGLVFDPVEKRVYVSDFDSDAVRIIDSPSGQEIGAFSVGDGPVGGALYRP